MKKFLFTILFTVCSFGIVFSETVQIPIIFRRASSTPIGEGIENAPINLPIEATLDDCTGILNVTAPAGLEGTVKIFSINTTLQGASMTINSRFMIPQTGIHIIIVNGSSWIGEAKFKY